MDALHGADIAMLGALVVSSSDLGRPRFVGEVSNLPAVRDRGAGQVVSVSLGASLVDSHFVLGSVHVPLGGDAGAWIQHESRDIAACTSEPLNEVEIFRAPRGRSISKIRISDCDDSTGMMTAAVLEAPPIMDRIADGTAHVYRLRCPTRLP